MDGRELIASAAAAAAADPPATRRTARDSPNPSKNGLTALNPVTSPSGRDGRRRQTAGAGERGMNYFVRSEEANSSDFGRTRRKTTTET